MFFALTLLTVAIATLPAVAITPEIERIAIEADQLYGQGRFSEALPLMKQAAEGGDDISMITLGTMYYKGEGVARSYYKAFEWWQRAADMGNTLAQELLDRYANETSSTRAPILPGGGGGGKDIEEFEVNGVTIKMVRVDGGSFMMGHDEGDDDSVYDDEKPAHSVTLSTYYIGQTEVTQELWSALMGNNPSENKGKKKPVENVSWEDCQTFVDRLNRLTGKHFRLPTEAEWEFAARGGTRSRGYKYSGSNTVTDVAWCDHAEDSPHNVAGKKPNELGIYDMSGNVWEWCADWYDEEYYSSSPRRDPKGPAVGTKVVLRGGSWSGSVKPCGVYYRGCNDTDARSNFNGFRLAMDN